MRPVPRSTPSLLVALLSLGPGCGARDLESEMPVEMEVEDEALGEPSPRSLAVPTTDPDGPRQRRSDVRVYPGEVVGAGQGLYQTLYLHNSGPSDVGASSLQLLVGYNHVLETRPLAPLRANHRRRIHLRAGCGRAHQVVWDPEGAIHWDWYRGDNTVGFVGPCGS
jgi:hypothetical protein